MMEAEPKMPGFGAARRVRALLGISISLAEQAADSGVPETRLRRIVRRGHEPIRESTWQAIAEMYERLANTRGERNPLTPEEIAVARQNRWYPPAAWDDIDDRDETPSSWCVKRDKVPDQVVVNRLIAGSSRVESRQSDRHEAVRQMAAAGEGPGTISNRLRMSSARIKEILNVPDRLAREAEDETEIGEAA